MRLDGWRVAATVIFVSSLAGLGACTPAEPGQADGETDAGDATDGSDESDTGSEAVCGDGVQDGDEECDDGNTNTESCAPGESSCIVCDAQCQEVEQSGEAECGDGVTEGSEECDDGNTVTETCEMGEEECTVCDANCQEVPGVPAGKSIARPDCWNEEALLEWDAEDEYTPNSAADLENAANAGRVALISNTFDATDAVLAEDQILVPRGGAITGGNIDLNGATVAINTQQAFSADASFSTLYLEEQGCLNPELFGAVAADTEFDDADAVAAMMNNGEAGLNQAGGVYNFNTEKVIGRGGSFKWSGNGSLVTSTLVLPGRGSSSALITFENQTHHEATDLEFDGNDLMGRFFYINRSSFSLDNVFMHNLKTTSRENGDRAIGYTIVLEPSLANQFKIYNSRFDDFEGWGDGIVANGTDGIVKVFWLMYTNFDASDTGLFDVYNVDSTNILGEDAEFIFTSPSTDGDVYDHEFIVSLAHSRFDNMTRRFVKGTQSNIQIDSCTFTRRQPVPIGGHVSSPTAGIAIGGKFGSDSDLSQGSFVKDSTFVQIGPAIAQHIAFNNVQDIEVTGNTLEFPEPSPEGGVTMARTVKQAIIRDNTFINCGLMAGDDVPAGGSIEASDNTFSFTIDKGVQSAAIRSGATTAFFRGLHFHDNVISFVFNTAAPNFAGMIGGTWPSVGFEDNVFEDNEITYEGPAKGGQKFIDIVGDFDATNTVQNNRVNGVTYENAMRIGGVQTFVNINNRDENDNLLTVE